MKITEKDLIGQLDGFPVEVVEKMLERQFEQTGKKDVSVFQRWLSAPKPFNGFDWNETKEEIIFWTDVINRKKFNLFFEKYPKPEYPKLMWVWDDNQAGKFKRVVFMKKNGRYLAWNIAETLKDAETVCDVTPWHYAEDVIESKIGIAPEVNKETCIKIIADDNVILETKVPMMGFLNKDNQLDFTQNIEIKIT